MTIKTKFNIGDRVWIETNGEFYDILIFCGDVRIREDGSTCFYWRSAISKSISEEDIYKTKAECVEAFLAKQDIKVSIK